MNRKSLDDEGIGRVGANQQRSAFLMQNRDDLQVDLVARMSNVEPLLGRIGCVLKTGSSAPAPGLDPSLRLIFKQWARHRSSQILAELLPKDHRGTVPDLFLRH